MTDTLQHKGYYADVHFSAEDEVFYGKIIGISDLILFEAPSVKKLKKAFIEAVEDYLATYAEVSKTPQKLIRELKYLCIVEPSPAGSNNC